MAHWINLVVQTLSKLHLVVTIESLVQCLYSYFAHSPKRHLEFINIIEFMVTKGKINFWNVKTRRISMLSLAKRVMAEYKTLLMKMILDIFTN